MNPESEQILDNHMQFIKKVHLANLQLLAVSTPLALDQTPDGCPKIGTGITLLAEDGNCEAKILAYWQRRDGLFNAVTWVYGDPKSPVHGGYIRVALVGSASPRVN